MQGLSLGELKVNVNRALDKYFEILPQEKQKYFNQSVRNVNQK